MKILEFDVLSSTNDYIKLHHEKEDIIVCANRQTAGRGSKERSFHSGMGGVYLSKLTHYQHFPAAQVFEIMVNASLAVCKTLEDFSLTPKIKWPNDIYVEDKKICGILIENTFRGNQLASSLVGVGINVNNVLPQELNNTAVTMAQVCKNPIQTQQVKQRLIFHLQRSFSLEEYKKYIFFFNQEIFLSTAGGFNKVTALDVDERGMLVVKDGNTVRAVAAGEVSLRF